MPLPATLRQLLTTCTNKVDPYAYASLIKACTQSSAIRQGKSVHCRLLMLGSVSHVNVLNTLIHFYASGKGFLRYACLLFDICPERTIVTFNCMISGFFRNNKFDLGLGFFNRILGGCSNSVFIKPSYVTLMILISACVKFEGYSVGKSLHSYSFKTGFGGNVEVCNALIDFYAKFGHTYDAEMLFDEMSHKDLVSWNTLITGYGRSNNSTKAFSLFKKMRSANVGFDRVSFIGLILACANSRNVFTGKVIHGHILAIGMEITNSIGTVLVNMYSKCGLIECAIRVFDKLLHEDIGTWNSMIYAYVECGCHLEALEIFKAMLSKNLQPDEVTMLGLISACRHSGDLQNGSDIHFYIDSAENLNRNMRLFNALIDMYAKCGSMAQARKVFDKMSTRDVFSWTSIIVGHAINGEGEKALMVFQQMQNEKVEPNSVTFLGVLLACDHAGLIQEGKKLYDDMCNVYNLGPSIEHYGCMVDIHARAGMMEEAYTFVKKMAIEPNAPIWRMLVNGCRVHGDIDMGLSLIKGVVGVKKYVAAAEYHIISSSMFAQAGKWDDVVRERKAMNVRKPVRVAGESSISIIS